MDVQLRGGLARPGEVVAFDDAQRITLQDEGGVRFAAVEQQLA